VTVRRTDGAGAVSGPTEARVATEGAAATLDTSASGAVDTATRTAPGSRARGYTEVGAATLVNGSIGVMVTYATMPTGMLLTLRMGIAAAIMAVPFLFRRRWRELRQPGVPLRLLAIGLIVSANLLLYFMSIRYSGVSVAIFLSYMAPVYIAIAAPVFLKESTEPIVWVALAVALVGMACIVLPGLFGEGMAFSAIGVITGTVAGVCYAAALMTVKSVRHKVASGSIVLAEAVCTTLAVLPLGIVQTLGATEPVFTSRNLLMALMLGAITTAFTFTLQTHGMRFIKVQHTSIIGYLEPVSAPFWALLFLSQVPSAWTLGGGALIVIAGVLLVAFGRAQEPEPEDVHA